MANPQKDGKVLPGEADSDIKSPYKTSGPTKCTYLFWRLRKTYANFSPFVAIMYQKTAGDLRWYEHPCLQQPTQHINTGWWYTYPSEKYEFVSWNDAIPNIWKNKNDPNHQPAILLFQLLATINHRLTIRLTRKIHVPNHQPESNGQSNPVVL